MPDASRSTDRWRRRRPDASPLAVRRLSLLSLICVSGIVLTGAAVRVTGSGLGCADWPDCFKGQVTPPLQFHSLIEFGNRMVTVLLVVVIGVTFLATLLRRPRRRDLIWLSGGLVAGVLMEAVLGGVLVYTKLNPYVLIVHFLATLLLVVDAAVLLHRSGRTYGEGTGRLLVPEPMRLLSWGTALMATVVLAAGAATTGTAPDSGAAQGQEVAKRIPMSLRDMAELHATMALFLIGLVVSLAVALHAMDVPERVRKAARTLVAVLFFQGVIGYTQYFTHLPAALVELHDLGATLLVIGMTQLLLSLNHHPPERLETTIPDLSRAGGDGQLVAPAHEGVGPRP